jgi:glycosyltransferase involved in cell wall biosynthesis
VKISVGILARNASPTLGATLRSLFGQTLLTTAAAAGVTVEVVVVANGCSDDTARIARAELGRLSAPLAPAVRGRAEDVTEAGKSNAWNLYVHELSDPAADFLVLLDADIEFGEPETLARMIAALKANPHAWVAGDRALKDLTRRPRKGLREHLSLGVTREYKGPEVWICGQAYCGRADVLRKIWMPAGLPVEDGFLWQMIVTDRFTAPVDFGRVILAPEATHYFEAVTTPAALVRHEKRVTAGICINVLLSDHLRERCGPALDAGTLVKRRNAEDPRWLGHFLREACQRRRWLVPPGLIFRRFHSIRALSLPRLTVTLPLATAAFGLDVWLFVAANQLLRNGGAYGYW